MTPSNDSPIFIVGHARSGTTLLRLMLSAHPNIYIAHETWFYFWEHLFPKQRSGDDFLQHYFQVFSYRWLKLSPAEVLNELPSPLPREAAGEALRVILQRKAAMYGRPRYGDKSPLHANYLERIFTDFPNARVILTVRDPRDTVVSISKTPWGSSSDAANAQAYEQLHRKVQPYASLIFKVKQDELLANPRRVMQDVLDFVDEPWDDAVLDHSAHRVDKDDMPPLPWLTSAGQPLRPETPVDRNLAPLRTRLVEKICRLSLLDDGYAPASLTSEPSGLSIARRQLAEAPASIRYIIAWGRLLRHLTDPAHWGPYHGGGDEEGMRLLKRLNPQFWQDNPGFEQPMAPDLIEAPAR